MGSILYIKQCPPRGGDTLFASMYAAYEALSDRMKTYLAGMIAVHDGEESYRGTYANLGVADKPVYPRAEHPVIRTHPVTGRKALYVNRGFTKRLLGVPRDESSAILSYLYDHAENPAVPVPVPLAGELGGVLGQPLRPASRDVGLLAAYALRLPRDGSGRQAGLSPANNATSARSHQSGCARLTCPASMRHSGERDSRRQRHRPAPGTEMPRVHHCRHRHAAGSRHDRRGGARRVPRLAGTGTPRRRQHGRSLWPRAGRLPRLPDQHLGGEPDLAALAGCGRPTSGDGWRRWPTTSWWRHPGPSIFPRCAAFFVS